MHLSKKEKVLVWIKSQIFVVNSLNNHFRDYAPKFKKKQILEWWKVHSFVVKSIKNLK